MQTYFIIAITAIIFVLAFDAIGAIASRKMNFNYSWLSFVSFPIYMLIGFFGTVYLKPSAGVSLAALVSLFDAVFGWKIALKLDANFGELGKLLEEELSNTDPGFGNVVFVILIGMLAGWLGTLFL